MYIYDNYTIKASVVCLWRGTTMRLPCARRMMFCAASLIPRSSGHWKSPLMGSDEVNFKVSRMRGWAWQSQNKSRRPWRSKQLHDVFSNTSHDDPALSLVTHVDDLRQPGKGRNALSRRRHLPLPQTPRALEILIKIFSREPCNYFKSC